MAASNFSSKPSSRPRPAVLVLVVVFHLVAIYGLAKAFAPGVVASVEDSVLSAFVVTVETKQFDPPPEPESRPDVGEAGEQGRKATPREAAAPKPRIVIEPQPAAPVASSTGIADSAGAQDQGSGPGAGGPGAGTGSGSGGEGRGGGAVTRPVLLSGGINNARDYPIPAGGRQSRIGTEVVVRVIVGIDGRASDCSVYKPSSDPQADAITCRLVVERLRFRPATNAAGNAVPAPFFWRQRWF